jgi:hypothetical protein
VGNLEASATQHEESSAPDMSLIVRNDLTGQVCCSRCSADLITESVRVCPNCGTVFETITQKDKAPIVPSHSSELDCFDKRTLNELKQADIAQLLEAAKIAIDDERFESAERLLVAIARHPECNGDHMDQAIALIEPVLIRMHGEAESRKLIRSFENIGPFGPFIRHPLPFVCACVILIPGMAVIAASATYPSLLWPGIVILLVTAILFWQSIRFDVSRIRLKLFKLH